MVVTGANTVVDVKGREMAELLTLEQRKHARLAEIRAGVERLREELSQYGDARGGRFWIYGSAASGRMRFDNDVDIIVDFEDEAVAAALDFVENACERLHLKVDAQPRAWCKPAFLERIATSAKMLPWATLICSTFAIRWPPIV